jgi:hypothetical protein
MVALGVGVEAGAVCYNVGRANNAALSLCRPYVRASTRTQSKGSRPGREGVQAALTAPKPRRCVCMPEGTRKQLRCDFTELGIALTKSLLQA